VELLYEGQKSQTNHSNRSFMREDIIIIIIIVIFFFVFFFW